MLDPWIIDEIRRREEEERQHREQPRPVLELPLESPAYPGQSRRPDPDQGGERGVVIVEFYSV